MSTVNANITQNFSLLLQRYLELNYRSGNSEPPIPLHISLLDFIRKITYGKYKKQPDFQEIIVQLEILEISLMLFPFWLSVR